MEGKERVSDGALNSQLHSQSEVSSNFRVSDTVNMKWHLIVINEQSNLEDNKQDERLLSLFHVISKQIISRET